MNLNERFKEPDPAVSLNHWVMNLNERFKEPDPAVSFKRIPFRPTDFSSNSQEK